jgi:hypothetical protein
LCFQVVRNLTMARDMIGFLAGPFKKAAKRVLRGCRGNIEDVQQGHVFQNLLKQHNIDDLDIEPDISEMVRPQPEQYDWLNQLVGGIMGLK